MLRKLLSALLVAVAIATLTGAIPQLIENVAYACDPSDPSCQP